MTAQPGRIKAIHKVPLSRPRDLVELQRSPVLGGLVHDIWGSLREEVQLARSAQEHGAR
jgi:NitT/TauT family transport system ATP-binding protein